MVRRRGVSNPPSSTPKERRYTESVRRDARAIEVDEDVTDKHAAEAARARLAAIVNSSNDAIIGKTIDGVVTDWNRAAEHLYGYAGQEMIGHPLDRLEPSDRRGEMRQLLARMLRGERIANFDTTRRRKDGALVDVSVSLSPVRDSAGHVVGVAVVAHDITERKRAMDALTESRSQLRALAARLQRVREDERTHLAREIHDGLGQALTALKIDLSAFAAMLPAADQDAAEKLGQMRGLIDATVNDLRALATELRPAILDDFGLAAAIESEVTRFAERTAVNCTVDTCPLETRIDGSRATDTFRILQEALTNIARHAGATQVHVRLGIEADVLVLSVTDNGKGIRIFTRAEPPALGLLGMNERVAMWGGELAIENVSPHGTRIVARVPLQSVPEA
jgi:two-component system, NarL family, sensor histidine kinase UhpB